MTQLKRKIVFLFLIFFFLADIEYSFLQHYHIPFDGDMAGGIVPAEDVKPILESPLGFKIFKENTTYPNPNRFFSHWAFYKYFNNVPLLLQNFANPIDSAYLSCALAKTIIQILLIILLSVAISGINNIFKLEFLFAAVLITPLFQTNGYRTFMGIIDQSTTYVFFYALPTVFLLIYFAPLFFKNFYHFEIKSFKYIKFLWIPLALTTSLSGPLNPGIALVVSFLLFVQNIAGNFNKSKYTKLFPKVKLAFQIIPKDYYFYLLPICIFSIYSLFLGRFNSVDINSKMPIDFLYSSLPVGIYKFFTKSLGFPVLFSISLINTIIINRKYKNEEGKKIAMTFKWIGLFSLVYILLLPLGGYRNYRPYILRYDTLIPITLCIMFIFGKTTSFIIKKFSYKQKIWYVPLIILVLFIYINADRPEFEKNECERNEIMQIAHSDESIVRINEDCTVLSWEIISNPQESELKTKLLKIWGIIHDDKLYYQKSQGTNTHFKH